MNGKKAPKVVLRFKKVDANKTQAMKITEGLGPLLPRGDSGDHTKGETLMVVGNKYYCGKVKHFNLYMEKRYQITVTKKTVHT